MIGTKSPRALLCVVLLACFWGSSLAAARSDRPNVLLVVIDTLRADRLAPFGAEHDPAPFLSALAKRSVVFTDAQSASSWTAPASASFLTSTYPDQHGILTGIVVAQKGKNPAINRIPKRLPTMAAILEKKGYRAYGVADNLNICRELGFARGFDAFETRRYDAAPEVNRLAAELAKSLPKKKPWFFYVHYMDPHAPYHEREGYHDEQASGATFAAYDSEIGFVDAHVAALFDMLPIDDDTLVVVTSDHGELFGEHGRTGHGPTLYRELLHVPLMISWPSRFEPAVVDTLVSTVDILPTAQAALGIRRKRHQVGRDLTPLLTGGDAPARQVLAMRHRESRELVLEAVIDSRWKLVRRTRAGETAEALYRREGGETEDLAGSRPDIVSILREALYEHRSEVVRFERSFVELIEMDHDLVERLEALGYVDD